MTQSPTHPDGSRRRSSRAARLTLLTLTLAGLTSTTASADTVTPAEALSIATRYVKVSPRQAQSLHQGEATAVPYYLFNDARGKGFVIVAGDDRMGTVLGYSDEGHIALDSLSPGLEFLLDAYRAQAASLDLQPASARRPLTLPLPQRKAIAPIVTARWGQEWPYNSQLPGFAYTGCVATAMAQIMYTHRWPAQGKGSASFNVADYNNMEVSADFSQSHYDWDHMIDDYTLGSTAEEQQAVGLLMRDAGYACGMRYTPSASSAPTPDANKALNTNFDYTSCFVPKGWESEQDFIDMIQTELEGGFPVYLSGSNAAGTVGHAWVADGMDADGLVHMNLGWNGQQNGYYTISNISLSGSGSEMGGRPVDFNKQVTALLIHPNRPGTKPVPTRYLAGHANLRFNESGYLTLEGISGKTFARTDRPKAAFANVKNVNTVFMGDIGIGIYDAKGELVKACPSPYYEIGGTTEHAFKDFEPPRSLGQDQLLTEPQEVEVNLDGLADGSYTLAPVYNERIDGQWTTWQIVRNTPTVELRLSGETVTVTEQSVNKDGYQLQAAPALSAPLSPGEESTVTFAIKSLRLIPHTGQIRLSLLDADDKVVYQRQTDKDVNFGEYRTGNYPVTLTLPADLTPGSYRVKLDVWTLRYVDGEWKDIYVPVNDINDSEPSYLTVSAPDPSQRVSVTEAWPYNSEGAPIKTGVVDLADKNNPATGVTATFTSTRTRSYEATLRFYFEDTVTGERIAVGMPKILRIAPDETIHMISTPIYCTELNSKGVWNDRNYRIVITATRDNVETELTPDASEGKFLFTFQGATQPGRPVGIMSADDATAPVVTLNDGSLSVRAKGLRSLRLYAADGTAVRTAKAAADGQADLPLRTLTPGVYLLQIVTEDGTHTRRIVR